MDFSDVDERQLLTTGMSSNTFDMNDIARDLATHLPGEVDLILVCVSACLFVYFPVRSHLAQAYEYLDFLVVLGSAKGGSRVSSNATTSAHTSLCDRKRQTAQRYCPAMWTCLECHAVPIMQPPCYKIPAMILCFKRAVGSTSGGSRLTPTGLDIDYFKGLISHAMGCPYRIALHKISRSLP